MASLLHGIGRGATSMARIERAARLAGYRTVNLDYPGRRQDIASLATGSPVSMATCISSRIRWAASSPRALLTRGRPTNLGRVVMQGPPSQGSEIADFLEGKSAYRDVFGPAGAQLGTRRTPELSRLLGPVDFDLGVIANIRAIDPLGWAFRPKPNDGKVTVTATKVDGMRDHITLPTTHSVMMTTLP